MNKSPILTYLTREATEFDIDEFMLMLGRKDLLTHEEEHPLIALAQQGDDRAMNRLLVANMRFVVAYAKQYVQNHVPLQQLIQASVLRLEQVIKAYDPTSGQKLFKFAKPTLRDALHRYIRANAPEPPKRETPPGVRSLKGIFFKTIYSLPTIDEYLQKCPFMLEDFLLTACDVENLVEEDENNLIDEVLSIKDGRKIPFFHRHYEGYTKERIREDAIQYSFDVDCVDFADDEQFNALCDKVASKRQDESHVMSELKWMNAPYIVNIAKEYTRQEVPLEELIIAGLKAFGEAVKQYDTNSEMTLKSFAEKSIRDAMQCVIDEVEERE